MSTFITRLDASGSGVRLAVKDLIDVEGVPTTAGCRVVADEAQPAAEDAALLAGARAVGARIVGKANLHELVAMWTEGKLRPHVSSTYPLERAAEAIREIADRRAEGKVVVVMDGASAG